jgi:hypothetical protein
MKFSIWIKIGRLDALGAGLPLPAQHGIDTQLGAAGDSAGGAFKSLASSAHMIGIPSRIG